MLFCGVDEVLHIFFHIDNSQAYLWILSLGIYIMRKLGKVNAVVKVYRLLPKPLKLPLLQMREEREDEMYERVDDVVDKILESEPARRMSSENWLEFKFL